MATLHIHLDESGNFVFSPKGTRFYVFTAVWTYNRGPLAEQLSRLRFRLVKDGLFRNGVMVLNFVLRGNVRPSTQKILVYTDTLPMKSRKEVAVVKKAITVACKLSVPNIPHQVMHNSGDSNYWIQVANYCC